jgi:hypothetical protein
MSNIAFKQDKLFKYTEFVNTFFFKKKKKKKKKKKESLR